MSRTSTQRWRTLRRRLMAQAIRHGTFVCATCGIPLDKNAPRGAKNAPELDHKVPVVEAPHLEFDPANLQWLCHFHNRQKGKSLGRPRMPTTRRW